ncbi:DUF748 domain-containing protein [Desulfuromonas thiophila]|uniref:DUF748 domain-containing protein n=1 Tax=Desulfuromonas thiophila TaxID=57664 RepID=UPI0029F55AF8|nr:DUF748 domain-containing protein [Desulfuromonas thiophila]
MEDERSAHADPVAPVPPPVGAGSGVPRWQRWLRCLLALLGLSGLLLAALPHALRLAGQTWLNRQPGVNAHIERVELNLPQGRLALQGLELRRQGEPVLQIGRLWCDLAWGALGQRRIELTELGLDDFFMTLRQPDGQPLELAGFSLPVSTAPGAEDVPQAAAKPWGFGCDRLQLRALRLGCDLPSYQGTLELVRTDMTALASWQPQQETLVQLHLRREEQHLHLDARLQPLASDLVGQGEVRLQDLQLEPLAPLLALAGIKQPQGAVQLQGHWQLTRAASGLLQLGWQGRVQLAALALRQAELALGPLDLDWQGQLRLQQSPESLQLQLDGPLQLERFALNEAAAGLQLQQQGFSWQGQLELKQTSQMLELNLTGDLALAALDLALPTADLQLRQEGFSWQGQLKLNQAQQVLELDLTGDLALADLQLQQPTADLQLQQQGLHWQGRAQLLPGELPDAGRQLWLAGRLRLPQLEVRTGQQHLQAQLRQLELHTEMQLPLEQPQLLQLSADLTLGPVQLRDQRDGALLSGWQRLRLESVRLQDETVQLGPLRIEGLEALRLAGASAAAVLQCRQLQLDELSWWGQRPELAVGPVLIDGLQLALERPVDGPFNLQAWQQRLQPLGEFAPAGSSAATPQHASREDEPAAPAPLHWRLASVRLRDGGLRLNDRQPQPPVQLQLSALRFDLGALDSRQPRRETAVALALATGQGGQLQLSGRCSPLDPLQQADLQLDLQHLALTDFAPYIEETLGYRIRHGAVDLQVKAPVRQGQIDLHSQLSLRALELGNLTPEQEERASAGLGMPLSLALALLRDGQGDIHLELPFAGDLSDPKLNIGPAVRTALVKAVQKTLQLTLAPVGALFKVGQLVGLGGPLALEPVPFVAGTAELLPSAAPQLKALRELLQQRPALRLKLCSGLSPADVALLPPPEGVKQPPQKKKAAAAAQDAAAPAFDSEVARELLRQRNAALLQRLGGDGGAQPGQLLPCQPDIRVQADPPQAQLSF